MVKKFTKVVMLAQLLSVILTISSLFAAEIPEFSDPSKKIEIDSGESFAIVMESNKTTGYEWQLAEPIDESALDMIDSVYISPSSELVGAGGMQRWVFKAMSSRMNPVHIRLKYVRPWEKNPTPAKEADFSVFITMGAEERQLADMQAEMDSFTADSMGRSIHH